MEFNISKRFKETLKRISSLSIEDVDKIRHALSALQVHIKPEVMEERAKASIIAKDFPDFPEIFQLLASLTITRFKADIPLDEFVHSISAMPETDDRSALAERLNSLLNIESVVLSARAFDIQHEYEKIFRDARIMTDIRPVFNIAGSEATGAMIVHNLTIGYSQDGDHKEIVVAMDDPDITTLKKLLERAETKAKVSEKLIDKAGIRYFDSK